MAQSSIANVEDYLKDLPEDRREIISTIRSKIFKKPTNRLCRINELGYDFL